MKNLGFMKIVEELEFEVLWDELELKKCFQRQSVTKYLRLTLVFIRNRAPREKFNRYFSGLFC